MLTDPPHSTPITIQIAFDQATRIEIYWSDQSLKAADFASRSPLMSNMKAAQLPFDNLALLESSMCFPDLRKYSSPPVVHKQNKNNNKDTIRHSTQQQYQKKYTNTRLHYKQVILLTRLLR